MGATFIDGIYGMVAQAFIDSDAVTPVYRTQRGFTGAITRNGVGDYSLTLDAAQDLANNSIIQATRNAALAGMIGVEIVSTTVLRVRNLDSAAMAAEVDFWLTIAKNGPN